MKLKNVLFAIPATGILLTYLGCSSGAKILQQNDIDRVINEGKSVVSFTSNIECNTGHVYDILLYLININTNKSCYMHLKKEEIPISIFSGGFLNLVSPPDTNSCFYSYLMEPGLYKLESISLVIGPQADSRQISIIQDTINFVPGKISYLGSYFIKIEILPIINVIKTINIDRSDTYNKFFSRDNQAQSASKAINCPMEIKLAK